MAALPLRASCSRESSPNVCCPSSVTSTEDALQQSHLFREYSTPQHRRSSRLHSLSRWLTEARASPTTAASIHKTRLSASIKSCIHPARHLQLRGGRPRHASQSTLACETQLTRSSFPPRYPTHQPSYLTEEHSETCMCTTMSLQTRRKL